MEEKKEKSRYTKFTFSLTDEQLAWLRAKSEDGYCIAKILQKMISVKMDEEKEAKK